MSSQVPTTSQQYISDIAFESSYPYSLHPTETGGSIDVGDYYWYGNGVRLQCTSGGYRYDTYCGPLLFGVDELLTTSRDDTGSSGYHLETSR